MQMDKEIYDRQSDSDSKTLDFAIKKNWLIDKLADKELELGCRVLRIEDKKTGAIVVADRDITAGGGGCFCTVVWDIPNIHNSTESVYVGGICDEFEILGSPVGLQRVLEFWRLSVPTTTVIFNLAIDLSQRWQPLGFETPLNDMGEEASDLVIYLYNLFQE